ncbi:ABC transporter permease [Chryseolinea sp. T2]|uniref:ABC transporter permease n=1 Tax=Chryseolinea sp. T2 TaxID=3129255 RepID=UPI003076FA12
MQPVHPPKFAVRFLRWFCHDEFIEEFEGDLDEVFIKIHSDHPKTARVRFFLLILRYLRPEFIKSSLFKTHNPLLMLRHNVTLSYRNFVRHKTSFLINLVGLSTGLACTLLIYLWVNDEYQADRSFNNTARLYQVIKTSLGSDGSVHTHETTPSLLADAMKEEIPEVEFATNVIKGRFGVVSLNNKRVKTKVAFAGKSFFNVFSFPLRAQDKSVPLSGKYGMYISSQLAQTFFGSNEAAIGKSLEWAGEGLDASYTVAGVFESPAHNLSLQFDVLLPFDLYYDTFRDKYGMDKWYSNSPSTYVILRNETNIADFNAKIKDFSNKKYIQAHGEINQYEGMMYVQNYADKYLNSNYVNGVPNGGRIDYIQVLSVIAVVVLLVACINFMNLSTAQATRRVKEVGVKKVVGASRVQLIGQYITESMLMAILALGVSLLLVALLLPQFNLITGKQLTFTPDKDFLQVLVGVTLFSGLMAGSYPAFYLSRFNPTSVLKGVLKNYSGKFTQAFLRKGLVAFQLAVSVVLMVAVLVIYNQIDFIQSRNLGFNKNNVISLPVDGKMITGLPAFMTSLKKLPGVVNASATMGDLVGLHSGGGGIDWPGKKPDEGIEFSGIDADDAFASTMNIQMLTGRFFNSANSNEKDKVIFNQAAIDAMQLKDPVGQTVKMWGSDKQIIGVVDNFHFESMYKTVGPFFIRYTDQRAMTVFVKLQNGREQEALASIGKYYNQFNEGLPFEYHFIDEDFNKLYASELQVGKLSRYFAGIAIVVSCLGLFGLAAFATNRRVKEIGIRKTLGSGEWRIIKLLTSEFTWMAVIAIAIAVPLSYYMAQEWLGKFAYRIPLNYWYFIISSACTLVFTWLTVGLHTVRAARINPATSLKYE